MSSAKAPRTRQVSTRELRTALCDLVQSALRRSDMLCRHKGFTGDSVTQDSEVAVGPLIDPAIEEIETENMRQAIRLQTDNSKLLNIILKRVQSKISNSASRLACSTEKLHMLQQNLHVAHSQQRALTSSN
jgi:hypothetical protein